MQGLLSQLGKFQDLRQVKESLLCRTVRGRFERGEGGDVVNLVGLGQERFSLSRDEYAVDSVPSQDVVFSCGIFCIGAPCREKL